MHAWWTGVCKVPYASWTGLCLRLKGLFNDRERTTGVYGKANLLGFLNNVPVRLLEQPFL